MAIPKSPFSFLVLSFATFSLLNCCIAAKIVLMPMFGDSHYFIFRRIAEELGSRGHQVCAIDIEGRFKEIVTLVIGSEQRYQPSEKYETLTFKAFFTPSSLKDGLRDFIIKNKSPLTSMPNSVTTLLHNQLMQCESLFNDTNKVVLEKLRETDLVFADAVYFCTVVLAEYLDALRVDFYPSAMFTPLTVQYFAPTPLSYVPMVKTESTDKMNFFERVKNVVVWCLYYCVHYNLIYGGLDAMKTKHNIKPERSAVESKQSAELVLFMNDFALDIPQPLNPDMVMVGPLLPKPAAPLPGDFDRFMSSSGEAGVVLVSFGSMMSSPPQEVVETLAKALGRLKQKVLWKINAKFSAHLSPNVKAVDWFPQNDILGHPKTRVFVSHMGLNSFHEAAYHGVPVVGIPLWGDQHDNAVRMARSGIGLWMKLYSFTSDDFYQTVMKVIEDESFKSNATRVSRLLKDRPRHPLQETADWVEYVLRHGGAKHLRPEVFNITWYQYYLLDVMLFLVAILVVVIKVVQMVCQCLCGICKAKTKNKTD